MPRKTLINLSLLLMLLWLPATSAVAQDINIRATVNQNQVAVDQRFEYTIEVSGASTSLPDPDFPVLNDFAILSGPNTSSSIQYINGNMSASKSYTFYLMPKQVGTFTIGPASIDDDGKQISSNSVKITVSKGQPKGKSRQSGNVQNKNDKDLIGENILLKTVVDKRSVYQNEQVLVSYKLYFRVNVRSFDFTKIPSNPGFWTEEFESPRQPKISNEIINGVNYQVATLREVALFPTQSGELTIEPLVISVEAVVKRQRRGRSLFDNFFDDPFGRTISKTLNTKPIKIKVKPLPANGKPALFSGAVGSFKMNVSADKQSVRANEAVSVKVKVSGSGNVKVVGIPKLNTPPDIEAYEPKENSQINRANRTISGVKTVEYILVPRREGEYTIKPIEFSYFDPRSKSYKKLRSKKIHISVAPGTSTISGVAGAANLSKQEVELLGQDIRYIKENAEFFLSDKPVYYRWWYVLSYLVPLLALVGVWRLRLRREQLLSDESLARRRKAGKIAAKHLSRSKKLMNENSQIEFYKTLSKALQGFVIDRLNLQLTDFNSASAKEALLKSGVSEDDVNLYIDCLEQSDFRQFSGSSHDERDMKELFEKARQSLTRLEKYI